MPKVRTGCSFFEEQKNKFTKNCIFTHDNSEYLIVLDILTRVPPPHCVSPRSTGIHSRAPTAAHQGVRPSTQTRTSLRPTGSRSHAPTSESRGAPTTPPMCTSSRSTGIHSRAPTATPQGACPPPHASTYSCPMDNRSRATTDAPRGVRPPPPSKGCILHSSGDLAVAGASPRVNIRASQLSKHESL